MLLIKRFNRNKDKLKEFFTQVKIKTTNKGLGLLILIEQIIYTKLFLLGKTLK